MHDDDAASRSRRRAQPTAFTGGGGRRRDDGDDIVRIRRDLARRRPLGGRGVGVLLGGIGGDGGCDLGGLGDRRLGVPAALRALRRQWST